MPADFLNEIIVYKKKLIERKRVQYDRIEAEVKKGTVSDRYRLFKKAISKPGRLNLIAEIKKASPSKGVICENFEVTRFAKTYAQSGADAISVLTEDKSFLGKLEYLRRINDEISLPLLRKDFIIDEVQIYESFRYQASAILLIMAILDDVQVKEFIEMAGGLDMDCLVEVHDERELERALKLGADIVGVNNRNLRTFEVDMTVSEKLIPEIPKDVVTVVESGIRTREDVRRIEGWGANAVLIGETFMKENDTAAKIRELMGEPND